MFLFISSPPLIAGEFQDNYVSWMVECPWLSLVRLCWAVSPFQIVCVSLCACYALYMSLPKRELISQAPETGGRSSEAALFVV